MTYSQERCVGSGCTVTDGHSLVKEVRLDTLFNMYQAQQTPPVWVFQLSLIHHGEN